ncbi:MULTISPECIES: carbohydrate ABC transporter permease [Paenibacillus]|uniref:carbohydrate ABC transporter permease n=1 Tax=Paenibacillus TaxID=44249 RepID=UPI00037D78D7|nr:sugar ABC transporter permease [Paenibacillus massiliensis]
MASKWWRWQQRSAPYVFISPFFILFMVFLLYPFLYSFYLSLVEWNGGKTKTFVGLDNYVRLFQDNVFWLSIVNGGIIMLLYVPLMLLIATLVAVLLNQAWVKGKGFFRMAFFTPNIMAVVAVSFVFTILLNSENGLVNVILTKLGIIAQPIQWLDSAWWARVSVAAMVMYRWMGYNMILILAGLQNIPKEVYESAYMDGASPFQSFTRITLPLLKKILVFCLVLSTLGSYGLFVEPFILTKGGPVNSTMTPVLLVYQESFRNLNFGYASAIAVMFFFLMMTLTFIQLRVSRDKD